MRRLYHAVCSLIESKAQLLRLEVRNGIRADREEAQRMTASLTSDDLIFRKGGLIGEPEPDRKFTFGSLAEHYGTDTPPPVPALPRE